MTKQRRTFLGVNVTDHWTHFLGPFAISVTSGVSWWKDGFANNHSLMVTVQWTVHHLQRQTEEGNRESSMEGALFHDGQILMTSGFSSIAISSILLILVAEPFYSLWIIFPFSCVHWELSVMSSQFIGHLAAQWGITQTEQYPFGCV